MNAKSGLCVVLKWKIYRPDPVIADVIPLTTFTQKMTNPYASPNSAGQASPPPNKTGMRRRYFWYVIGTVFSTAFLLDLFLLPTQIGLDTLLIACGPGTLYFHHQWMGVPRDGAVIGVLTAVAVFLYLVIPSRATLIISVIGGVVWSLSGYFWIAMLA